VKQWVRNQPKPKPLASFDTQGREPGLSALSVGVSPVSGGVVVRRRGLLLSPLLPRQRSPINKCRFWVEKGLLADTPTLTQEEGEGGGRLASIDCR